MIISANISGQGGNVRLYNSLSNSIEPFEINDHRVTIYVCGITPYDTTHLGHAFTYACVDILIRYLELQGVVVRYVQNVTDIDDDILRKSKESNESWIDLGNRWTAHFIQDMQVLNVRPPDYYPRATDVIPEIIEGVHRLIDSGMAYISGGSVYFEVSAWSDFGILSNLSKEEMLPLANERGNNPDDPNKRDPLDFVLWQTQSPGEPAWESPWGPGRPGWHIECSTMSTKYLGTTVDVHSGGADLRFPHHECEIAQVEPITNKKPFVRYWMHAAMVYHDGEKMSKSLGNLVMVRDLLEEYTPDALRLYLGSHHYRESWSYSKRDLEHAANNAKRLKEIVSLPSNQGRPMDTGSAWAAFYGAMDDDLNTPQAYQVMLGLAELISEASRSGREIRDAQETLEKMASIFGMRLNREGPEARVLEGWEDHLNRFM